MIDLEHIVRQNARWLHRQGQQGNTTVLQWFQTRGLESRPEHLLRRHAFSLIASRLGCSSWSHVRSVLDRSAQDVGSWMHHDSCGFTHIWSADLQEAQRLRQERGGFLLPYRRHFFVAQRDYIEAFGLDPKDPDWENIGWDWVSPTDPEAWARLASKALRARLSWEHPPMQRTRTSVVRGGAR